MIKIKEASYYLGVSTKTLRRWEKIGKIKSYRTIGNHRRYDEKELEQFKNEIMINET